MFELNETLKLNETTLTWVDRTYRTERGLRRFLATLTPAQLAEAEVLVDDDSFVVFYPANVAVPKNGPLGAYHFDLDGTSLSVAGRGNEKEVEPKVSVAQPAEAECARRQKERELAFNILLAGVRL